MKSRYAVEPRRVEKPWGWELVWAEADAYVGKLLFVRVQSGAEQMRGYLVERDRLANEVGIRRACRDESRPATPRGRRG